ncbi:unannotated protein [freshwater metagenome]|uniref:Unannotated protein n=1 Tax=freshwater metagenome TaxID=449393 RepID=A0A6J7RT25_9ZZZZ
MLLREGPVSDMRPELIPCDTDAALYVIKFSHELVNRQRLSSQPYPNVLELADLIGHLSTIEGN